MLGAIIGDCIGSVYEGKEAGAIPWDAPLFSEESSYTDDSVLTIATAFSLQTGQSMEGTLRQFTLQYVDVPYGGLFTLWAAGLLPRPYKSHGLGGPMRISSVAYIAQSEREARQMAYDCVACTHNSEIAMAASACLANAILMGICGAGTGKVAAQLDAEMRPFLSSNHRSLSEAMLTKDRCAAALLLIAQELTKAADFSDLMRRLRACGDDTDTLCSIGGAVAEPLLGIPPDLVREAEAIVPHSLWTKVERFRQGYVSPHVSNIPFTQTQD